jgi:hypothetical protein
MPVVARGFVDQAQLKKEVAEAAKTLSTREVRDVQFSLGTDSSGEPAIFFGILLTQYGSRESRLGDVTGRVATGIFDAIQPYNRWGLQPYFSFTSDPAHYASPDWI